MEHPALKKQMDFVSEHLVCYAMYFADLYLN
jgi:hypothetical protein